MPANPMWGPQAALKLREGEWQIIHLHGTICLFEPLAHTHRISPEEHFTELWSSSRSKSVSSLLKCLSFSLLYRNGCFLFVCLFQRRFWAAELSVSAAALWIQKVLVTTSMVCWCLLQNSRFPATHPIMMESFWYNVVKKCFWMINYFLLNENGQLN